MSMTINNPFSFPLVVSSVTVTWNDDKGHQTGADKTLKLTSASLGGVTFWSDPVGVSGVAAKTIATSTVISSGATAVSFTFNQSYDNADGTERIVINFSTPGCETTQVDSRIP